MQNTEQALAEKGQAKANPMLLHMLKSLDESNAVYNTISNVAQNRKLWDNYGREWKQSGEEWVQKMASHVNMESDLVAIGDEWAPRLHTEEIINEFILPFLKPAADVGIPVKVAEIGCGGGRIALEVLKSGNVQEFRLYDISQVMLSRASTLLQHVSGETTVSYHVVKVDEQKLEDADNSLTFIYCFDVLPHCELHVIYCYLLEIKRTLKAGGRAFISTADITSDGGFQRFQAQRCGSVGGFCFCSPEAVLHLVKKTGLVVLKIGERRATNTYLNRDFLLVVEKQA